ncbi:MAG: GNAT family N-acetyltransferase [Sphingomonas sp.]|nr:GNAT family N-acetyltransferase [Sphingomonas sp.]
MHSQGRDEERMPGERAAEIRSERLLMRRASADDLDAIFEIMSDPQAMRFWSTPAHDSIEVTARWLDSMMEADRSARSDEFILQYEGSIIGKLGAWRPPEIGFFLHREYWGRGLASEALRQFIVYAAGRGLDWLTADVDPRNCPCIRLLERTGFVRTGEKKASHVVAGHACDSIYFRRDVRGVSTGEGRDR